MPTLQFPARRTRRACAFTLVELLTVIAIVGILAAIIIPVVGNIRASARAATCASNLRQIGVAARLWSGENKGLIVPVFDPGDPSAANWLSLTTWAGMLAPYTGWQKPDTASSFRTGSEVPVFHCPDLENVFGYGYNYTYLSWMGSGSRRWARYSEVPRPSRTLMIVDSVYTGNSNQWRAFVRPAFTTATDAIVDYRHPGGSANVLWVDGHVSAEKKTGQILVDQNYWGVDVPRTVTPM